MELAEKLEKIKDALAEFPIENTYPCWECGLKEKITEILEVKNAND